MKTELAKRAEKALENLREGRAVVGKTPLEAQEVIARVRMMAKEEADQGAPICQRF